MKTLPFILIFSLTKLSASIPLEDFYPYGAAQGDTDFPKNDDGSSPVVTISTKFPFFNNQHDSLYVNTNGAISFQGTLSQYTPESFPLSNSRRIIAPFWADVDIRNGGTVWYRETTDSSFLQRATDEVRLYYPSQNSFRADWVFIATWDNVAFYGSEGSALSKRNTFQAILITDGRHSFTIFNYYIMTWTTGTASGGTSSGLGGTPAQVGFNAGDGINYRAVNESRTAAIINLPRLSNVHVDGKFVFRIDTETIEQGGCNAGGALTISPQYSNMFGGEKKVLSGPCIQSDDVITASFGSGEAVVHCTRESMYSVACVTPTFYTTGDVSVTMNVMTSDQRCNAHSSRQSCRQNTEYQGKITIRNPLDTKPVLQRVSPSTWIQGGYVTLRWQTGQIPFDIGGSSLEIFTVRSGVDHKPKIRHQSTAVQHISTSQSQVSFTLQTNDDVIILSLVQATNTSNENPHQRVWSEAIVVTPRNTNESRMSCDRWQTTDDQLPSLSGIHRQVCPCRFDQANIDGIRFRPDPLCKRGITRQESNCLYHPLAQQCFRLNTPGPLGTGQLCCYDNNGNLMDMMTSSGGGSLQRFHYFGDGEDVVPYLSNIVFDTAPYYHCCIYPNSFQSEVSSECYEFYQRRTPGNCHEYVSNTPAQSTGVSHFVTPDGLPYTFNGVGEFTLFRTIMDSFIAQVRLQAFTNNGHRGALITSFAATAVNASDTVEIRLNSIRGFDILINGVVQDITGVTFLRYKGATISVVHNNSTSDGPTNEVSLAFPEFGISFQALVFDTHMNLGISFDPHFQLGSIEGLLGNFNHNASDDLAPQHGQTLPANSSTEDIHHNMGLSWRVKEEESLFTYAVGTSHSSIQDSTFVPTFEVPPSAVDGSMRAICGNNTFCYYDYYVTHDKTLALSTQTSSETLSNIQQISRQIVTCGIPPAVQYGQWNTSGMEVGDTAQLLCNSETQLRGSGYIICNTSGDWTDRQSSCVVSVVSEVTELPTDGTTSYISTPPPTAQTSNVTATTQTNPLTRSDIDCGGSSISLHVPLDLLPSGQQVTWNDPACVVSNNGTHLTGDIDLGECGTYVVFNTTHVIFENELVSHASTTNNTSGAHSVIDYGNGPDSVIVVQCVYPRREQESLGFRPIQGQVRFYEKTLGHMQIHMREARDVLFDDMYPSQTEPRVVHLNDPIYIKLDTEQGNTTKVAINVDRCLATPSPSPLDTDFQELTDNGCPALPSVTIHSSPVSEVHLSFQAFKFTNHPSAPVYVHCEVYVCPLSDPHCVTGCMDSVARTRRAATGGIKTHLVSTGPFPVADDKDQGAFGGESTALVAVTGLCAVLAVAATVFGVMAWRGRRRLPLKETLVQ